MRNSCSSSQPDLHLIKIYRAKTRANSRRGSSLTGLGAHTHTSALPQAGSATPGALNHTHTHAHTLFLHEMKTAALPDESSEVLQFQEQKHGERSRERTVGVSTETAPALASLHSRRFKVFSTSSRVKLSPLSSDEQRGATTTQPTRSPGN